MDSVPVPVLDADRIAQLRDALAGGQLALQPDQELAMAITARWPETAALVRNANEFHRRAATWAVVGGAPDFPVRRAAGVIFAASGFPIGIKFDWDADFRRLLPGAGFHPDAAAARPDAMFAYAEADPEATAYNQVLLGKADPLRVAAYQASAREPKRLLEAFAARTLLDRGPVMVQLQLCCHWWPPEFCTWAVGEYARLLPPGSTLALSLAVPGGTDDAGELMAEFSRTGGAFYPHTEADVAGWIAACDLTLVPPGVADVRGRGKDWAAAEFREKLAVARVVEAIAVVP
jgi:hypothetical protein